MIVDSNLIEPPELSRPPLVLSVTPDTVGVARPAVVVLCPIAGGTQTVVAVLGQADISTAAQMREQFADVLAARPRSLLVDLAGLDFCDFSGLDALGEVASAAAAEGLVMTVQGCSPQLSWLLDTFAPRSGVRPAQVSGRVPQARRAPTSGPAV